MQRTLYFFALISSLAGPLVAAEPQVVFEDRFEEKLADGWSWLREHQEFWRLAHGALEIRDEPGDGGSVKNALLRKAPDRSQGQFAIEVTVTNLTKPTQPYEQAGITWYQAGQPVFKLVKELVSGQVLIVPGFKPLAAESVQLRVLVTADSWTAQYRPDGQGDFQTAATGRLPPPGDDQVSIQCYHGPTDAEHWIRFDDFRMLKLAQ